MHSVTREITLRICSSRFVALSDERRGTRDTRLRYVDLNEPPARHGLQLATAREAHTGDACSENNFRAAAASLRQDYPPIQHN